VSAGSRQYVVEAQTISFIYRAYNQQEPITNLMQVFTERGPYYPHDLDAKFRAYGKHAGFTNSFYEKYIFFPPGLTNRHFKGELLFMNAKPYPAPHDEMQRQIVSWAAGQFYTRPCSEKAVQQMFREMGIQEPKPEAMPPPPAPPPGFGKREPLTDRFWYWFITITSAWGVTQEAYWVLLFLMAAVPLLLLILLARWLSRRRPRSTLKT
jgi:hypothetical protein